MLNFKSCFCRVAGTWRHLWPPRDHMRPFPSFAERPPDRHSALRRRCAAPELSRPCGQRDRLLVLHGNQLKWRTTHDNTFFAKQKWWDYCCKKVTCSGSGNRLYTSCWKFIAMGTACTTMKMPPLNIRNGEAKGLPELGIGSEWTAQWAQSHSPNPHIAGSFSSAAATAAAVAPHNLQVGMSGTQVVCLSSRLWFWMILDIFGHAEVKHHLTTVGMFQHLFKPILYFYYVLRTHISHVWPLATNPFSPA